MTIPSPFWTSEEMVAVVVPCLVLDRDGIPCLEKGTESGPWSCHAFFKKGTKDHDHAKPSLEKRKVVGTAMTVPILEKEEDVNMTIASCFWEG